MSKLIVLVGLPASGKSTLAEELSVKYNATILSSDAIREEILGDVNNQSENTNVFEVMNNRAKVLLSKGGNVIYDATNINRKRRVHLIKQELKADEYICYYLGSSIGYSVFRDGEREREVGYEVIDKMYKTMQIPVKSEGWSDIHYLFSDYMQPINMMEVVKEFLNNKYDYESFLKIIEDIDIEFRDIKELSHDSTYHAFSVSRHTYYVYEYILNNYKGNNRNEMLVAAIYHDLGKAHCKSFINFKGEETRYASFIGHEYVSSQLAYNNLKGIGLDEEFIIKVVTLIQFHMKAHDMSNKTEKKLRELLGEEMFNDLLFFNEADNSAK